MVGGSLALDFVNTVNSPPPTAYGPIETYADLLDWAQDAGMLDPATRTAMEITAANDPGAADQVVRMALGHRTAICAVFSALADGRTPTAEHVAVVMTRLRRRGCEIDDDADAGGSDDRVVRRPADSSSPSDQLRRRAAAAIERRRAREGVRRLPLVVS